MSKIDFQNDERVICAFKNYQVWKIETNILKSFTVFEN